jgi:hypothetical protein
MAGIRERDVWKLDKWDSALLWYAKAIAEMQTRPIQDPTNWRYQVAIQPVMHYFCGKIGSATLQIKAADREGARRLY